MDSEAGPGEDPGGGARRLADRVEVRRSPVHGRGVFARRRLRKGEYIGRFEGERTRRNGAFVLWIVDDDGAEIGIRGRGVLRFLNHASRPNAEFRGDELFALREVPAGDELLIDYGGAPDGR